MSHEVPPFGRGPHVARSLGDENDHHGYSPLTKWNDPSSSMVGFPKEGRLYLDVPGDGS